jgi:hypothetical protein
MSVRILALFVVIVTVPPPVPAADQERAIVHVKSIAPAANAVVARNPIRLMDETRAIALELVQRNWKTSLAAPAPAAIAPVAVDTV